MPSGFVAVESDAPDDDLEFSLAEDGPPLLEGAVGVETDLF